MMNYQSNKGAALMEAALLIALIGLFAISALTELGNYIEHPFTIASSSLGGVGTESGTDRPAPPPKGGSAPSE